MTAKLLPTKGVLARLWGVTLSQSASHRRLIILGVIPAKRGSNYPFAGEEKWILAFAGMTSGILLRLAGDSGSVRGLTPPPSPALPSPP